jgi:hypothetical protein
LVADFLDLPQDPEEFDELDEAEGDVEENQGEEDQDEGCHLW